MLERAQRDKQSLCETQGLPAAYTATLHLSRTSLQVLATLNKKLTGHMEKKRSPPRIVGLLLCSAGDLFPLTIPRWRWGMRILQGNSSPPLGNRPSQISVRRFPEPSKEDKGSKNATLHQSRRKAAAIVALTFEEAILLYLVLSPEARKALPAVYILQDALLPYSCHIIHNAIYQILPFPKAAQKTGSSA